MKILVTGAAGLVGSALCPALEHDGHTVVSTDAVAARPEIVPLDIADPTAPAALFERIRPDVVIHLAAETDVDRCEQEPAHAYRVNAAGTEHVARACRQAGARLVYVSTAAVFDGEKPTAYLESDPPNPVNVYGRTKLAGEYAVRRLGGQHQIVRASWVVGGFERDKKFVGKMLRLLESQRELSVVTDKIGSLTFTVDFVQNLAALVRREGETGVFHMANRGACSRHEVACKIVEFLGRTDVTVRPVTSDAFPLPAPRGRSEAIRNLRLETLGLDRMPTWQDALQAYVRAYLDLPKPCASSF